MGRMSEQHREEQERAALVKAERLDAKAPAWLDDCYRKANGISMADVAKVACGMALTEEEQRMEGVWDGPMAMGDWPDADELR